MKESMTSAPKEFKTLNLRFRRVPLDAFKCRHCGQATQTSESHLCDALLCQGCFAAREKYRQGYPRICHPKAEFNFLGDRYGKQRIARSLVCASCEGIYELISDDYVDVSLDDQKKHYDRAVEFNKNLGAMDIEAFEPTIFEYKNAPKGWTNEILCAKCFDNIQVGHELEIKQLNEVETEKLRCNAALKNREEIIRRNIDDAQDFGSRMWSIIFLIFIPIFFLKMCDGTPSENNPPSEIYYRK